MLTLFTGTGNRDCAGLSRRDFLRAGALGVGGLTLPWLLRAMPAARAAPRRRLGSSTMPWHWPHLVSPGVKPLPLRAFCGSLAPAPLLNPTV